MSEQLSGGTLSIGYLDFNRNYLLSPNKVEPELITIPYPNPLNPSNSPEDEAKAFIQSTILDSYGLGLVSASDRALIPANDGLSKGYLLRGITRFNPCDYGLASYNMEELQRYTNYLERIDPRDVRLHFLPLIIRYMA